MFAPVSGAVLGGWQPPHLPRRMTDNRRQTTDTVCVEFLSVLCRPSSVVSLQLLHLPEFQLHRRGAAEDRDRDLEARAALVDFLHRAVERGERAVGDADLLADFE